VVPAFDVGEDGHPGLRLALEPALIEQFALERGEEALAQRIVVSVAHRAHGRAHAGLPAALAECVGRVLAALIGMMDDVRRPALCDGHVEGVQHQAGAQVVRHRPADDAPTEGVHHYGQVDEAVQGRHVG